MAKYNELVPGEVKEDYIDFLLENTPYRLREGVDTRPILKEHFLNGVSLHPFVKEDPSVPTNQRVYWMSLNRQATKIKDMHLLFCSAGDHIAIYKK
jgi:hypothetical protein